MERFALSMNKSVLICNGNEPLPKQGGMERVTDALVRGLVARGIKVILLCINHNRLGEIYTPPCPLYFLPANDKEIFIKNLLVEHGVTHIIDQGEGELIGKFGFFKKRDKCFDDITLIAVQHSNVESLMNNYKDVMSHSYSNFLLQWCYNHLYLPVRKLHSLYIIKLLHRDLSVNYDKIVLLSPSFISVFKYYNSKADQNKLRVIPNMNTYEKVDTIPKKNRVLFVGRLMSNIKGCDKLLRIWKCVGSYADEWQLDIVGDGPDRFALENYAKELGFNNVVFHGFKDPTPFYQQSKIFCMTSVVEGFGMVLIEAQQHGVVPIAFESYKAVKDIIDDSVDGFLIPPFNERQYAKKLQELMGNANYLKRISERTMIKVQRYCKDNIIDKWIKLLDEK